MGWNYRVVHHRIVRAALNDGVVVAKETADEYAIHEVYYDAAGEVEGMTTTAIAVAADSVDELRTVLDRMREALDKPVLEYDVDTLADDPDPNDHDVA